MMELLLQRLESDKHRTHGDLSVDDVWQCYTLEDPVRAAKIHGQTAIPAGRYPVTLEESPRFGVDTITINGVPGFSYIRIHAGNDEDDTEGCPLVGQVRAEASILKSRAALAELKPKLQAARDEGQAIWITIKNAEA